MLCNRSQVAGYVGYVCPLATTGVDASMIPRKNVIHGRIIRPRIGEKRGEWLSKGISLMGCVNPWVLLRGSLSLS